MPGTGARAVAADTAGAAGAAGYADGRVRTGPLVDIAAAEADDSGRIGGRRGRRDRRALVPGLLKNLRASRARRQQRRRSSGPSPSRQCRLDGWLLAAVAVTRSVTITIAVAGAKRLRRRANGAEQARSL